jgi:hypothetical protein
VVVLGEGWRAVAAVEFGTRAIRVLLERFGSASARFLMRSNRHPANF